MDDLPPELKDRICTFVPADRDLKALSLTSTAWAPVTRRHLFATAHLVCWPSGWARFLQLVDHPVYAKYVRVLSWHVPYFPIVNVWSEYVDYALNRQCRPNERRRLLAKPQQLVLREGGQPETVDLRALAQQYTREYTAMSEWLRTARRASVWVDIVKKLGPIERVSFDAEDVWTGGRAPALECLRANMSPVAQYVDSADHLIAAMVATKKMQPRELEVRPVRWPVFLSWNDQKNRTWTPWLPYLESFQMSFNCTVLPEDSLSVRDHDRKLHALVGRVSSDVKDLGLHYQYTRSRDRTYMLTQPQWPLPVPPLGNLQRLALTGFRFLGFLLREQLAACSETLKSLELRDIGLELRTETVKGLQGYMQEVYSMQDFFQFLIEELSLDEAKFEGLLMIEEDGGTDKYTMDRVVRVAVARKGDKRYHTAGAQLALAVRFGEADRESQLDEDMVASSWEDTADGERSPSSEAEGELSPSPELDEARSPFSQANEVLSTPTTASPSERARRLQWIETLFQELDVEEVAMTVEDAVEQGTFAPATMVDGPLPDGTPGSL